MSEEEYLKLIKTISDKSGKQSSEVEKLVGDKVNELSGLVTKEGAAYIVSNELGVKIDTQMPKKEVSFMKVEEVKEPNSQVAMECRVIKKYDKVNFNSQTGTSGSVQSLLVGDETGIIRISFWNDKTDVLENISQGDILRISNMYSRENQNMNRVDLHFGTYSEIEVNPQGLEITLKEYTPSMEFTSKKIEELEDNHRNVSINGKIVDFEIPRFYLADPKTFKKVLQEDGKYISQDTNEEIEPIKVPIINFMIDDGSGKIGVVGFRDRALEITKLENDVLIDLANDNENFTNFTKNIIGKQVEIGGNISVSNMSGEKQMIINGVVSTQTTEMDLAKKIVEEDKKEEISNEEKPQEEDIKIDKNNSKKLESEDLLDDDIDIENIDLDDDML